MSSDIIRMRFGFFTDPDAKIVEPKERRVMKNNLFIKLDGLRLNFRNVKIRGSNLFSAFKNELGRKIQGALF
jgi:hypothetical protein